jgi:hypothetical protein
MMSLKRAGEQGKTNFSPAKSKESFNHLPGLSLSRSSYLSSLKIVMLLLSTGLHKNDVNVINIDRQLKLGRG